MMNKDDFLKLCKVLGIGKTYLELDFNNQDKVNYFIFGLDSSYDSGVSQAPMALKDYRIGREVYWTQIDTEFWSWQQWTEGIVQSLVAYQDSGIKVIVRVGNIWIEAKAIEQTLLLTDHKGEPLLADPDLREDFLWPVRMLASLNIIELEFLN